MKKTLVGINNLLNHKKKKSKSLTRIKNVKNNNEVPHIQYF